MSELFCKRFSKWIYDEIGYKIDNDFYSAISNRDIELVYILKRNPEWLAYRFTQLCRKNKPNYEEEIKSMLIDFKEYEIEIKER